MPRHSHPFTRAARTLSAMVLRGYFHTYHRIKISGRENLPTAGSFILVANHASHLDAAILQSALPLKKIHALYPAAAQDYFFTHPVRRFLATVILNVIPFARRVGFRHSLRVCRHLLATPGNGLVIFPEGTRSRDGRLAPFRAGIGLLLAGTSYTVIPCHLQGVAAAWPKGALLPRPFQVELRIGAARCYAGTAASRDAVHAICRDLHAAVGSLSNTGVAPALLAARSHGRGVLS